MRPLLLSVLALLALSIAASEYVNLRALDRDRPADSMERLQGTQPWGGLAGREAARLLETRWRLDPSASADGLWWQMHRYPMDPWRWLLLARVARQVDEHRPLVGDHMRTAVGIQPGSRAVRWQSAQLAQATGYPELVIEHLSLWLADQPHMSDRALFVANRWIDDPGEVVDRVLPATEDHFERAMRFARASQNPALAEALWQRLDHPRSPNERVVAEYIRIQQSVGDPNALMAVWQDLDPLYRPGQVPAGHFGFDTDELAAFGWNLREPEGVTIKIAPLQDSTPENRKPSTVNRVLKVTFNGEENPNLRTPLVRFPMPDPGRYYLTGYWRGEGLTTRALPYIHVRNDDNGGRETLHVPGTDFDWTRFAIPVEITEPGQTVRLQFIRRSTGAFDRYIEGDVSLADLLIEEAQSDGGEDS